MKKLFAYMDMFFSKFQLMNGCENVGQNAYFGASQHFPRLRVESYVGFEDFQPRIGCM